MDPKDSRRAFDALAGDHGLPILRFLRDRDWALASQVAEGLGIHTSTASKYLVAFHEAGILERRPHASRRPTFAYRLASAVVRVELDLAERADAEEIIATAEAFAEALAGAAHRVGGARLRADLLRALFGGEDWRAGARARVGPSPNPMASLQTLLADARRVAKDLLGTATAERLIHIALKRAAEGREDIVAAIGLAEGRA